MFAHLLNLRIAAMASFLTVLFASGPTQAAVLSGSGPNLLIPTVNPGVALGISRTVVSVTGGFTGTWSAPVQPDWIGTFNATGPIPNNTSSGTTRYDFSTLPNGNLPAGTFFTFGDFDGGSSTTETLDLIAFDGSGNPLSLWLDEPVSVFGSGTGTAGAILPGNLPGWDWNVTTTNTYRIDGSTVTGGNPTVAVQLLSNQPIVTMIVAKGSTFNSFSLRAPVIPEPASASLIGMLAMGALTRRGRRQS